MRCPYTRAMGKLAEWMTKHGWNDRRVGEAVALSRVQISRLRRGRCKASVASAVRLQKLTGLPWHAFIHEPVRHKRGTR